MANPKKSLSQNFLVDKNISKKIVNQSNIENHIVLEIGPGYGFMTDNIIENQPNKLLLIEKDNHLSNYLKKKYKEKKNVSIIEGDIKPRVATLKKIRKINSREVIDEGIILWFPGPKSYTGDDMLEFHVHGSRAVIDALLNEISKIE